MKDTKRGIVEDQPGSCAVNVAEAVGSIGSALDRAMETRGRERWRSPDERIGTGVWECDAGRFIARIQGRGEFIQVVSGRMTCIEEDGPTTELGPGDSLPFPAG